MPPFQTEWWTKVVIRGRTTPSSFQKYLDTLMHCWICHPWHTFVAMLYPCGLHKEYSFSKVCYGCVACHTGMRWYQNVSELYPSQGFVKNFAPCFVLYYLKRRPFTLFVFSTSRSRRLLLLIVVLTSHSAIFQLYSDGTDVQFPNFYLLPGTHAMGS